MVNRLTNPVTAADEKNKKMYGTMGVGYGGGVIGSLVTFILTVVALYYVLTGRGERIR